MPAAVRPVPAGLSQPAFDGYTLVRLLAQSAHSQVWEARVSGDAGRRVALKAVARVSADDFRYRCLRNEFDRASALSHPAIARPVAWLQSPYGFAIAYRYLSGGDLAGLAGFDPGRWLGPMRQLADALRYLHHCGIAHGDIKARNILLDERDRARLIDLGHARESSADASGERVGAMAADWQAYRRLLQEMRTGAFTTDTAA